MSVIFYYNEDQKEMAEQSLKVFFFKHQIIDKYDFI